MLYVQARLNAVGKPVTCIEIPLYGSPRSLQHFVKRVGYAIARNKKFGSECTVSYQENSLCVLSLPINPLLVDDTIVRMTQLKSIARTITHQEIGVIDARNVSELHTH